MGSNIKTLVNDDSVEDFINSVDIESRRQDGFKLLEMFTRITGEPAKMWGSSIVGFGKYHYKSNRSRQEGDWPMIAFSPRKQNLSLYILSYSDPSSDLRLLEKLGKYKRGAVCLYINKMSDVNVDILGKLIKKSYSDMKKVYSSQ